MATDVKTGNGKGRVLNIPPEMEGYAASLDDSVWQKPFSGIGPTVDELVLAIHRLKADGVVTTADNVLLYIAKQRYRMYVKPALEMLANRGMVQFMFDMAGMAGKGKLFVECSGEQYELN